MQERRQIRGLFVGLTTLDLIYHAESAPAPNEKVVASEMMFAAGGPATNAAIAFAALGGHATLLSVIGQHPLAQWIHSDLNEHQIHHVDLMSDRTAPPTVSSIVVTMETGDRAIVSKNSQGYQLSLPQALAIMATLDLQSFDVILFDGHQMALSQVVAEHANRLNINTIFDGGSWKPGSEVLLPDLKYILCSSAFQPPSCGNESETLNFLRDLNAQANLAITHGSDPIVLATPFERSHYPCPSIQSVDTLGAGDFFHGAFAWFIVQMGFKEAIPKASAIAGLSCQFPGTREWLSKISQIF